MNEGIAGQGRNARQQHKNLLADPDAVPRLSAPVADMPRDARSNGLSGETSIVKGELHPKPDGYRYRVSVDENPVTADGVLQAGSSYRMSAMIWIR